jgi:hypothetical protein
MIMITITMELMLLMAVHPMEMVQVRRVLVLQVLVLLFEGL